MWKSFCNLFLVWLLFQNCVWRPWWEEVHGRAYQQWHNLLSGCRPWSRVWSIHCSFFLVTLSFAPQRFLLSCAPGVCLSFPPSSCFFLLARCPAKRSGQVQGPVPGSRYGCSSGPEQGSALPVASLGAQLRRRGSEGSGGASVRREAGSGPRHLYWWFYFLSDTHTCCPGTNKAWGPGSEGDRPHIWQLGGWQSGAHGYR